MLSLVFQMVLFKVLCLKSKKKNQFKPRTILKRNDLIRTVHFMGVVLYISPHLWPIEGSNIEVQFK